MTLDINSIFSIGFKYSTLRNGHLSGLQGAFGGILFGYVNQVRARFLLSDPLGGLTQWG